MSDEIVGNLKKSSAWLRVLFMAGFAVALYVAGVVLLVLMLAQIVFSLVTGSDNVNLRRLGASLSEYVAQILAFLTYNNEEKPFPFAPFPLSDDGQHDVSATASARAETATSPAPAAAASRASMADPAASTADSGKTTASSEKSSTPKPAASKSKASKSTASKSTASKPAAAKSATKKSISKGAVAGSKDAGSKSND